MIPTISWQGHLNRVMHLNWLHFCGICRMIPMKVWPNTNDAVLDGLKDPGGHNFLSYFLVLGPCPRRFFSYLSSTPRSLVQIPPKTNFSIMIKLPVKSTGKWSRIRFDLRTYNGHSSLPCISHFASFLQITWLHGRDAPDVFIWRRNGR